MNNMQERRNLISKRTGIGDHMGADIVTDSIFPNVGRYIDVIKVEEDGTKKLGECIKNQYVPVNWIEKLIGTKEWQYVGKKKALYEYFVDTESIMKPNLENYPDQESMYKAASGDMQFDFDDVTDDMINDLKNAFMLASEKSPVYRWFEYSWSHNEKDNELSGCHIRIYVKLGMKTKLEWGFYYIHFLNGILKYVSDKYRNEIMLHIDWSCCTVTRGFAIPYNEGGVLLSNNYDENKIKVIDNEDELDRAFNYVNSEWFDELFEYYMRKFVGPKKKNELVKMGLVIKNDEWKFRYSMEDDWIFDENHPFVDGEDYNYNWRLSLVTTLMGVFDKDKERVRAICAVIYKYIRPYKNHTYEEMLYNELEHKIFNRANFELEPSHDILHELWEDWGLKIRIRRNIL